MVRRHLIRPLTPELLPAFEDLFGKPGASNGCWCMYWRLGGAYREHGNERNRRDFRKLVKRGPPPGLLAFDDDVAVGWCQLTPRDALPHLEHSLLKPCATEEAGVWSISCFFVRRGYRRRGITVELIAAAVKAAECANARALEAYPVDTEAAGSTRNDFTGTLKAFERCGFEAVAPLRHGRVVARLTFRRARAL